MQAGKFSALSGRDLLRAAAACFAVVIGALWVALGEPTGVDILRLCTICVAAVCLYLGARESTPLNPYFLFSLTPISLLAYNASVSSWYLPSLSVRTWALAVLNMGMFLFGLVLVKASGVGLAGDEIDDVAGLRRHARLLLIIGLLPTAYGVIVGLPVLLSGDWLAMSALSAAFPLSSTFMLAKYPAIACALKSRNRRLIAVTVTLSLLALALNFNKSQLALMAMTVVVSLYRYYGRKARERRWLRLLLVALVIVGVLSVALFDVARSDFDSTANLLSKGASWKLSRSLLLPYMYLVSSWTNLDYVVNSQPGHTYGLWAAKPILGYFGADKLFEDAYVLSPYSSFNTFTFIAVQFKDFGFLGSGLASFLMGLLIARLYHLHLASASPMVTAVYALNAVAVLEMFFSNHFFSVGYPVTIVLLTLAYRAIFIKGLVRRSIRPSNRSGNWVAKQPSAATAIDESDGAAQC